MKFGLLPALLLFSLAYPAQAKPHLKYFATLKGECEQALIDNFDRRTSCNNNLHARLSADMDNELSFEFRSEQFNISFSGSEINKKDGGKFELVINKVTTGQGNAIASSKAKGICNVSGGMSKLASIKCNALDLGSRIKYRVTFKSKSKPEYVFTFGQEPFDAELNIRAAIRNYDTIYKKSGIDGAQKFLENCYPNATKLKRLPTLLMCFSIDTAAASVDKNSAGKNKKSQHPYFTESAYDNRLRKNFEHLGTDKDMKLKMRSVLMVTQRRAIKELKKLNKDKTK